MNHGVIEEITVPPEFEAVSLQDEEKENNYVEFRSSKTSARICYEETCYPLSESDRNALQKLFAEQLPDDRPARRLMLGYKPDGNEMSPEDMAAYFALCQSFVFGGQLVRGGACINEEKSSWEVRRVGQGDRARTVIVGNLYFHGPDGRPVKNRQARVVMPITPGDGGNGYLWLEGTEKDIKQHTAEFFDTVVGQGKFRELTAAC